MCEGGLQSLVTLLPGFAPASIDNLVATGHTCHDSPSLSHPAAPCHDDPLSSCSRTAQHPPGRVLAARLATRTEQLPHPPTHHSPRTTASPCCPPLTQPHCLTLPPTTHPQRCIIECPRLLAGPHVHPRGTRPQVACRRQQGDLTAATAAPVERGHGVVCERPTQWGV